MICLLPGYKSTKGKALRVPRLGVKILHRLACKLFISAQVSMVLSPPPPTSEQSNPASMEDHTASTGDGPPPPTNEQSNPASMEDHTASTGDGVAVVVDSESIVLLENNEMQAEPVCEEINPRGGIQNRIDYDALASGLSDNANVHISRASVSDTDSKLKSMGKEISLVGTIKSKVNLKSGYTNKFIKDLRINILVAGAQGLGKSTLLRALVFGICKYYNKEQQWETFLEKNKK